MDIGYRLRSLREQKNLSQEEVEKRTGLIRSYISRVENSHTVPSVATMEKMARALEIPLYQLLYDGEKPRAPANRGESNSQADEWGSSGKNGHPVNKLCRSLARMSERDRQVLMSLAQILTKTQRIKSSRAFFLPLRQQNCLVLNRRS
jgi:transcriptional regulator with XRE-family HTH domain